MGKLTKQFMVFSTVIITLMTSLILDFTANKLSTINSYVIGVILIVLFLNVLKFSIWNIIHKNFEISKSYPLTSIFFPLIFVIAFFQGNVEISITKVLGVFFIIIGIFTFDLKFKK